MMEPQDLNYFANLEADTSGFVLAYLALIDRMVEGNLRDVPARLAAMDFSQAGDLSYLTIAKLQAAKLAIESIRGLMNADDAAVIAALYGIVR